MPSIVGLPEGIAQNTAWLLTPQEAQGTAYQLIARACKRRQEHDRHRPVKSDPGAAARQATRHRFLSLRCGIGVTLDIRM